MRSSRNQATMTKRFNILVSIAGRNEQDWQEKLKEIEYLKITEVALFLELYEKAERKKIYEALLNSGVKNIPLVHIRHDMTKDELKFLQKNYRATYFTCHEENFVHGDISRWKGFYKNIYLEMNFDKAVSKEVKVEKIGGFCIDLAHFKCGLENLSKDFEYVFNRKDKKYFICNHVNGYNPEINCDMHTIYEFKNFDYLKTLPAFVFGECIALETFNSIKEQLKFKKYVTTLLSEKL